MIKDPKVITRIKNINFNLGYIAYHLLTGKITKWEENQDKYLQKVREIQKSCKA